VRSVSSVSQASVSGSRINIVPDYGYMYVRGELPVILGGFKYVPVHTLRAKRIQ